MQKPSKSVPLALALLLAPATFAPATQPTVSREYAATPQASAPAAPTTLRERLAQFFAGLRAGRDAPPKRPWESSPNGGRRPPATKGWRHAASRSRSRRQRAAAKAKRNRS